MSKVTYIEHNGREHVVDAQPGQTLMDAATSNMVPGILADCGGSCSCATCHVYVDEAWSAQVGQAEGAESDLLEIVEDRRPTSRLSCQVRMRDELEGLVVRLPERQA